MSRLVRSIAALVAVSLPLPSALASKGIWEEYEKRVTAADTIGTVGPDEFGERIEFQRGSFSLRVTDVSLPGNSGLAVAFTRTFVPKTVGGAMRGAAPENNQRDGALGDWEIELPNIGGVFSQQLGWVNGNSQNPGRCSSFTQGPSLSVNSSGGSGGSWFGAHEYSHGVRLNLPGGGGALLTPSATTPRPAAGARWITADWTVVNCLPSISNGAGEGFIATTSDGTRYWFNWMAAAHEQRLTKSRNAGISGLPRTVYDHLPRRRFALYATRVEDRFGNWVTYTYSNSADAPARLNRIEASDGRLITVSHNANGHVQSVSTNGRSWNYAYAGSAGDWSLSTVTLPDSSSWQIALDTLQRMRIRYYQGEPGEPWRSCGNPGAVEELTYTGTVRHPSGALATYAMFPTRFVRSGIDYNTNCALGDPYDSNDDAEWYPSAWDSYAVVSKRVQGDGFADQTWNYSYEEGYRTVVSGPGEWARYTYGNTFRVNEGKLLRVERGESATQILQRDDYAYELAKTGMPYPTPIGTTINPRNDDFAQEYLLPQKSRAITREGAVFTQTVTSFDAFARPLTVTKSNTLGHSKSETTTYHDHVVDWVLGLPASTSTNGFTTATTDYNARHLPYRTYRNGRLQNTLTYNTDGTLATVADANSHVTSLSDWKRGIPQTIQFPTTPEAPGGAIKRAGVDDNGWITSVTDEVGARTCYAHDPLGRTSLVTYPSETQTNVCDTSRWTQKRSEFRRLADTEWMPPGIALSRWRHYSEQGNRRVATYYDALWRPVLVHEYDGSNINPTLRSTRKRYDGKGRVVFQSNVVGDLVPDDVGTRTVYDALDRVLRTEQDSELGVLSTTTEYLADLRVRITPPRGFPTITQFMAWDEPSYELPVRSDRPEHSVVEIQRHPHLGRPERLTQRSADASVQASRHYVYDPYSQLCKTIEPETGATVTQYDAAGNVEWQATGLRGGTYASTGTCSLSEAQASGRVVSRTYDARDRLTQLSFPDGRGNEARSYFSNGLLATITSFNDSATTGAVQTAFVYTRRGLPSSETVSQPGWYSWRVGYDYDAIGNLRWQSYPTGLTLDYAPNALGQATQVRDTNQNTYASGASYYPNGALKQFTYGNGIVHTMTQNARQLPQRATSAGVIDYAYSYDSNGNVANIWDHARDTGNGNYGRWMTYDGLDRLTAAGSCSFGGDCWHRFTYDAIDNLRSWKLAGVKDYAAYVYDADNRLTGIRNSANAPIVSIGYDAQGNLSTKNNQSFQFDYGNRMRGTDGTTYRYDGAGRRVQSTLPDGKQQLWMYSQSGQMLFSWDGPSTQKTHEHLYLAGSIIAIIDHDWPGNTVLANRYQHTDALGSPVAETDASGGLIVRNDYEPFGAMIGKPQHAGIGYTGHVMDGSSGLTYMQQRYYDPSVGRFLSIDPVTAHSGSGGNFNRYWYGNNNPYKFVDPDGRCTGSHIENRDGTCKFSGDFTTMGVGPTLPGAQSVVHQASIEAQTRYNPATAVAQVIGRNSFETKIRVALAKGDWETAAFLLENSAGEVGPVVARAVHAGSRLGSAGYTRNSLNHVFVPKHQLEALVTKYGSQEVAMLRIHESAQMLVGSHVNGQVIRGAIIDVGGQSVWVQGRILDGIFRLSSASMRGVP